MNDVRTGPAAARTPAAAEAGGASPAAGGLLARLAGALAGAGVRYCTWKRVRDWPRLLRGEGDLDLLVSPRDVGRFLAVAEGLGFRQATRPWDAPTADEFHLYGLDPASLQLLHLHGTSRLFSPDRLPAAGGGTLEDLVLGDLAAAPDGGLPVLRPRAELVVLVLHTLLRYGRLSELRSLRGKEEKTRARLQALMAQGPVAEAGDLAGRWLPGVLPAPLAECAAVLAGPAPWWRRFRLGRRLRRRGIPSGGGAALRAAARLLRAGWWRLTRGRAGARQLPAGGAVVALVGPEACGKSTLVAEATSWLGRAFRVRSAHLGKPPSTWLTLLPNLAGKLLAAAAPRLRAGHRATHVSGEGRDTAGLVYAVRAVLLAWDRRALARRLARQAARGWLVVCDRYPSPLVGAADSARLDPTTRGRLGAYLARLEQALYRGVPPPTVLIRLTAPLTLALERNQERRKAGKESDAYVATRHRTFVPPSFPGCPTVELDTNVPRSKTVAALRRLLWEVVGGAGGGTADGRPGGNR